ncbi:IclR family transcriptional regulator [Sanguibacter antarcticus]|uniref:IclR family transcriptional regulator n=1 Tax=Sanguibacter antarcticus TaxID=372484 RepID=A0A2A9E634_9MICO|nr:IclR family transcriptional regulator [Sanguibacter antarcticus]PFG33815.1 IclR family transcriptional regulator [Sanguibacter antarcticus]
MTSTHEPAPTTGSGSPMNSVDKALLALQDLSRAGRAGLSLSTLATHLGLNKTSLHRTLAALRHRGFVDQDPETGNYVLGAAAAALSSAFFADENLPGLLHTAVVALSREADELVHLGVLSGAEMLYVDKVEPARSLRVWSAVGRRQPAATTALGRAVLSHRDLDRVSVDLYAGTQMPTERLLDVLATARTHGYATEDQENEQGISCLAVPLLRDGVPVAAMSITAPSERMTPARHRELVAAFAHAVPAHLPAGIYLPDAIVAGRDAPSP